jgi:hypothetical protein
MKEIREILAKMVFDQDFDMGNTTVKELIDFLMEVGRVCGSSGYDIGAAGRLTKEEFLNKCFPTVQPKSKSNV